MYSENDYIEAKSALKKFIILYGVFALAMIGAIVAALIIRVEWLSYTAAGVLTIASLFIWGNVGVRLYAWNRFLKDMRIGLEREVVGELASIDEDDSLKEGLEFRALRLLTGEESDKAGGRLLYVDASRFPLSANLGQKVCCKIFGSYLKEIKVLEED
jgi:hypothetical protein